MIYDCSYLSRTVLSTLQLARGQLVIPIYEFQTAVSV